MEIASVSTKLRPRKVIRYPKHQRGPRFEQYVYDYLVKYADTIHTELIYLPIFWDTFHVIHGYGDQRAKAQKAYDAMCERYPERQFFTIVDYMHGTLIDAPDMLCYNAARYGGVPLPLLCDPHPVARNAGPKFLGTFAGALGRRHPIRGKMAKVLERNPEFKVREKGTTRTFRDLMNDSVFALCPRGSGPTSYRLFEAIQMGCIPVYIYDEPVLPMAGDLDWSRFCVLVHERDIGNLSDILHCCPSWQIESMRRECKRVYEKFFNFKSTAEWIAKDLNGGRMLER